MMTKKQNTCQTFNDMIQEEIVNTLINQYDWSENKATKFAKKTSNRIEAEMWTTFDSEIEHIMENK